MTSFQAITFHLIESIYELEIQGYITNQAVFEYMRPN